MYQHHCLHCRSAATKQHNCFHCWSATTSQHHCLHCWSATTSQHHCVSCAYSIHWCEISSSSAPRGPRGVPLQKCRSSWGFSVLLYWKTDQRGGRTTTTTTTITPPEATYTIRGPLTLIYIQDLHKLAALRLLQTWTTNREADSAADIHAPWDWIRGSS